MNSEIGGENGDESNRRNEAVREAVSTINERLQESGEKVKHDDATKILGYASKALDDFAKEVYEAFKSNTNAHLFVYVLNMREANGDQRGAVLSFLKNQENAGRSSLEHQENPDYVICYFKKIENSQTVILVPLNNKEIEELMNKFDEIKNSVKKIDETEEQESENEVEKHGEALYRHLTGKKEVLQPRECNSPYGVWINCKDEAIDPLWEWLYIKSEDFFWGDKFSIVRIPESWEDLYLFSFSELKNNKKQQEKLLKHLQTISPKLSRLIENAEYLPNDNELIKVINNGNEIATLEIEDGLCYFKQNNKTKIKIGIAKRESEGLSIYIDSNIKIRNIAVLKGIGCHFTYDNINCLDQQCSKSYREQIELNNHDRLKNLDGFDGIHVVASRKAFLTPGSYENYSDSIMMALNARDPSNINCLFNFSEIEDNSEHQDKLLKHLQTISPKLSPLIENAEYLPNDNELIKVINNGNEIATLEIKDGLCYFKQNNETNIKIGVVRYEDRKLNIYITNSPRFLFLNLCGCSDIRSKIIELIPAEMLIDNSLEVPEKFALIFAKAFYEEVCGSGTGKNVVKAVTNARGKIKNQNNNNFWRFAYFVKGNPSINVTLAES